MWLVRLFTYPILSNECDLCNSPLFFFLSEYTQRAVASERLEQSLGKRRAFRGMFSNYYLGNKMRMDDIHGWGGIIDGIMFFLGGQHL